MILWQIYSGNLRNKFHQNRLGFIKDITKNILVSFFSGHSVQ